jgi:hypothetical protein
MDIHIHHHMDERLALLLQQLEAKMAAIDDELAKIKASLDLIQSGVSSLLAKIAAMPTAGLTAEQQSALDAISTEAQAIAVAANPVAPTAPAAA